MLSNEDKSLENVDVKTPSPLSSLADRSFNEEEEEDSVKSGSSSGESSPSDLRKRLQSLPSPNEPARLASRVISISRRLSRKRDLYFYGTTNRIEENDEKEEKEDQEERPPLPRKFFSDLKARDARARRRAKIRFESSRGQPMGVSHPSEDNASGLKSNSNDETSARGSTENNQEISVQSLPSMVETPRDCLQRYPSMSARTPTILSPYRDRCVDNDSSRSQENRSLLRLYSNLSSEDSPKDKIELQPLSPTSLINVRPTKFGGYRPRAGVILQNLSSGSEPESNRETASDRLRVAPKTDRSMADVVNFSGSSNVSPASANKSISNFNDRLSSVFLRLPSTTREDCDNTIQDSSRTEDFKNVVPCSVSKVNLTVGDKLPSLSGRNDPQNSLRLLGTQRSDSVQYVKDNSGKTTFLSARSDTRKKQHLQTPSSLLGTQVRSTRSRISGIEASGTACYNVTDFEEKTLGEYSGSLQDEKETTKNYEALSSDRSFNDSSRSQRIDENKTAPSTPGDSIFGQSSERRSKPYSSNNYGSNREIKSPRSVRMSEEVEDHRSNEDIFSQTLAKDDQELFAETSNPNFNSPKRKEYANVPTLVLNSREASYSASPVAKAHSEKRLNANDLIEALSNVSLTQQTANDANVGSEPCSNRNTVSRSESSGNNATPEKSLSVRSSFSLKSRIPVKVSGDRTRMSPNEEHLVHSDSISSKQPKDADNLSSRTRSIDSKTFDVYSYRLEENQVKSSRPNYEGDFQERVIVTARPNLLQNRIGDGRSRDAYIEELDKSSFEEPLTSSPEAEKTARNDKTVDRIRFSLERLAAEQFRRNIHAEQTRTIQSETVAYATEKFYETPPFSLQHSSSMSKLRHPYDSAKDSPRKKSQDRFPFTISEKTSATSMKFKVPGRLENVNQDANSLDRTYKLDMHPSLTRLAGSGFEDSPADLIDYVVYNEQEGVARSSGMKGLVQKFSARLRRSTKKKTTTVIYENRAYHGDSLVDSCSESSLMKEFKMYENMLQQRRVPGDSPDEKSSAIPEKNSPNSDGSGNTSNSKHPWRRQDREDLWIQEIEDPDETPKSIEKDPYSVFFVKNVRETPETSGRLSLPKDEPKQGGSTNKRNRVKFRGSPVGVISEVTNENVHKEPIKSRNFESTRTNRNAQSGCLCLRFCRMIMPDSLGSAFKYRSRIKRGSSSPIKKKVRLTLKRRKG